MGLVTELRGGGLLMAEQDPGFDTQYRRRAGRRKRKRKELRGRKRNKEE